MLQLVPQFPITRTLDPSNVCNNQKVVQNDSLMYRFLSSQNSSSTFIYSILDIWAILVMNGAGLSQSLFVCSLAACDITCRQGKCQSHSNVQPHVLIITRDQQNIFGQLSRFWLLRFYPLSAPQKNTTMVSPCQFLKQNFN